MAEKKTVVTPPGITAFVSLLQAKSFEGGPLKYSCVLIFDAKAQATDQFKKLKALEDATAKQKWPNGLPPKYKTPFRPSEEKAHVGFPPGCVFITISTELKPDVVDAQGNDILDSSEVFSGMIGRASVTCYPYDKSGNRGVAFGLNNYQKIKNGSPMGSKSRARDDFDAVDGADMDEDLEALLSE